MGVYLFLYIHGNESKCMYEFGYQRVNMCVNIFWDRQMCLCIKKKKKKHFRGISSVNESNLDLYKVRLVLW